jgi:hypothetical protein
MSIELDRHTVRPFQFSLRQLLVAVALFSFALAGGRWFYLTHVFATPLTAENNLADYVGQRVTITGTYEDIGKGSPSDFVYFGSEPVGIYADGYSTLPVDGQAISVTGRLIVAGSGFHSKSARSAKEIRYCIVP